MSWTLSARSSDPPPTMLGTKYSGVRTSIWHDFPWNAATSAVNDKRPPSARPWSMTVPSTISVGETRGCCLVG